MFSLPTDILRYKLFVFLGYLEFTRASGVCREMQRHWQHAQSKLLPLDCVCVPPGKLDAAMLKVQRSPKLTTLVLVEGTYELDSPLNSPLHSVTMVGRRTIVCYRGRGIELKGDCHIPDIHEIGINVLDIYGRSAFTLNKINSEQMCDGLWYPIHYTAFCELYKLYQREHTYKYLTDRLTQLEDPWWDDSWWANRKPVVKRTLEDYLIKLVATPPHIFDISKKKHDASPIMCVSPFPLRPFMDRTFLDGMRTRRRCLERKSLDRPTAELPKPFSKTEPTSTESNNCLVM